MLRALGAQDPPAIVEVQGVRYQLLEEFKHDSWAATALYHSPAGRIICKFNRVQPVLGIPMRWLGRTLAQREAMLLNKLHDVPGVARWAGDVLVDGRPQPNAVARLFIAGHPLHRNEKVADDFFPRLLHTLTQMHARDIAYVDLHKRENLIVSDQGHPYFIDFQICFHISRRHLTALWPWPQLLSILQQSDLYHLHKHRLQLRPDQVPADQRDIDRLRPWPIRLHRTVGVPFRTARRRLLVLMGVRSGRGMAHTETAPEDAVRRDH